MSDIKYVPKEKLFAAMVYSEEEKGLIDVFLVNPHEGVNYEKVVNFNGGFVTSGDDLIETSKRLLEYGPLNSLSAIKIDLTDDNELDFTIWYMIDLYDSGKADPTRVTFSLPRYVWFDKKNHIKLPILDATGHLIKLVNVGVPDKRLETIANETDLESKVTTYSH